MATLLLIIGCAVLWAPAAFSQGHGSGPPGQSAGGPGNGNANPPGQGAGHGNGNGSGQPQGHGNNGSPPGQGGGGPPGHGPGGGGPPGQTGAGPGGWNSNGQGQSHGNAPAPAAASSPAPATGNGHGNGHGNGNGHGVAHGVAVGHSSGSGSGNGNGNGNGHGSGRAPGATRHGSPTGNPSSIAPVTTTPVSTPTPTVTVPTPVVTPPVIVTPTPASPSTSTSNTGTGRPDVHRTSVSARSGTPAVTPTGSLALTGLGAGALAAGTTGGHTIAVTQPLASATAQAGPRRALSGRAARRDAVSGIPIPSIIPGATVIQRFVSSVPTWLWIVLAVSLALAAIGGVAALGYRHRARRSAAEVGAVTAAALTDPLTGVFNRRGFTDAAERELARARRYQHPLALAFVDVRGLKAVNDSQGHVAGDQLLRKVAGLLSESARTNDLVGRIGGDELAVLLVEQSEDGAAAMARRVRAQVPVQQAALGFDADWDVTIGTSTFPEDGQTLEDLLQVADRRLYRQRGIEVASTGGAE